MKKTLTLIIFGFLIYGCSKNNDITAPGASEPKPNAHFKINNLISPGLATQRKILDITNDSKNAITYKWEFGNDCNSNSKVPDYSFLVCGGPFTIKLTATSKSGESSSYSESLMVECSDGTTDPNP